MKEYFECQITMTGDFWVSKNRTEELGWKFSAAPADSKELEFYATKRYGQKDGRPRVTADLKKTSAALESVKTKILRRKIELVIYDERIK